MKKLTDHGPRAWYGRNKESIFYILLGLLAIGAFSVAMRAERDMEETKKIAKIICQDETQRANKFAILIKQKDKEIRSLKKEVAEAVKKIAKIEPPVENRFNNGDCVFGDSGTDSDGKTSLNEAGYMIGGVDKKRKQYLLKCLTEQKKCTGGLKTWWIKEIDTWLIKVRCDMIKRT